MPIQRLNHAVLYVRDVDESAAFYTDVLNFERVMEMPGQAAFLRAADSTNDHDLGLFQMGTQALDSPAGRSSVGLYHLAWEVDTLAELQRVGEMLQQVGALTGSADHGTTKALYARDPNNIEFEVSWIVPASLLTDEMLNARKHVRRLDIEAEIARFGADTTGGVGISHR